MSEYEKNLDEEYSKKAEEYSEQEPLSDEEFEIVMKGIR